MRRGSITVFMSLLLVALLLLSLVLSEAVRYGGLSLKVRSAGNTAIDSLMAGYDRELLEEYGLLFLDGGYGKGLLQEEELRREFLDYFGANTSNGSRLLGGTFFQLTGLDAVVTEIVTATDYRGEIFIRSVLDYYKYEGAKDLLADLGEKAEAVAEGEAAKEKNEKLVSEGEEESLKADKKTEGGTEEAGGDEETPGVSAPEISQKEYENMVSESPVGAERRLRRKGWIQMVIPEGRTISAYRMDTGDFPSLTAVDDRSLSGSSLIERASEKALFNEYLLRHFSSFTDTEERTGVQYEVEYILYGEDNDQDNLKKTLNRLLLIREGLNIVHIHSDPAKLEAAEAAALALAGWTGLEPVVELVKSALIGAWAFAESLIDLRDLLSGYSVPLNKEKEDWNLGLGGVGEFLNSGGQNGKKSDRGEDYEGYLRILLYLNSFQDKAYRTMDMVQSRRRVKDPNFLMMSQIYAITVRADAEAKPLFLRLRIVRSEKSLWGSLPYTVRDYFSEVY